MGCSASGSFVHGDSPGKNAGVGLPCPPPGDLPNPGIEPRSPTLQVDSLPSEPPGKPITTFIELWIIWFLCVYISPLQCAHKIIKKKDFYFFCIQSLLQPQESWYFPQFPHLYSMVNNEVLCNLQCYENQIRKSVKKKEKVSNYFVNFTVKNAQQNSLKQYNS